MGGYDIRIEDEEIMPKTQEWVDGWTDVGRKDGGNRGWIER